MPHDDAPLNVCIRAHPNIALVKYWGKRPGAGNLPAVGSLSVTLDTLATVTRLGAAPADATGDAFAGLDDGAQRRMGAFVAQVREQALAAGCRRARAWLSVHTRNNFPTAAGLASSASGFAALALALARAWQWPLPLEQLSGIARQGSGSAARSLFDGFVHMESGLQPQRPAQASQVLPAAQWPLRVLVAVVHAGAKATSSTAGMQHTQATSPYWPAWLETHEADLAEARAAVESRDFARLARVTEHSCLKMHASMLAAAPGLLYWLPATVALMHAVRELRAKGVSACFTIDAGPQVKVLCTAEAQADVTRVLSAVPGVQSLLACGLGPGAHAVPIDEA